jgi:hypothetical protein
MPDAPFFGFLVEVPSGTLRLSAEHSEYLWLDIDAALQHLEWETNRVLLRELHERLTDARFADKRSWRCWAGC